MSDPRPWGWSPGARVRTGQSARMCASIVPAVSAWKPSPAALGSSNSASTNPWRLNPAVPRVAAEVATIAAGSRSGRASAKVLESGKIPESWTSWKRGPRSRAGSYQPRDGAAAESQAAPAPARHPVAKLSATASARRVRRVIGRSWQGPGEQVLHSQIGQTPELHVRAGPIPRREQAAGFDPIAPQLGVAQPGAVHRGDSQAEHVAERLHVFAGRDGE